MLAAVLEDVKKMTLKDVPMPKPNFEEALVRVKACGICQTDFKAYTGERKNFTPPVIVEHEMSGIIEEIGKEIKDFKDSFSVTPKVMLKSINLMDKGLVNPTKIITHEFPLEKIQEALKTMYSVNRIKIIIKP